MEAYIDDMFVQSALKFKHVKDLQAVLKVMRANHMKLNPLKCAFGVKSGKFLRFMLSHHGIKANLEKLSAITRMQFP